MKLDYTTGEWYEYLMNNKYAIILCDENRGFEDFRPHYWTDLIIRYGRIFFEMCQKYNGLADWSGWRWADVLIKRPEYADECKRYGGFEKMDGLEKKELLSKQPELEQYFLEPE